MAWNGSGTYTRTNGTNTGAETWQDDAAAGTKILSSRHDTHDEDLATAINACITQNNESKPTADFAPNASATYDLGTASLKWQDLHLSGAATIAGNLVTSKGSDVASATALALGTDGNYFDVTGTTTITSINTVGIGTVVKLHFDDSLTLTHNATDLILPGGANILTNAGDEAEFVEYATGDWRCLNYQKSKLWVIKSADESVNSSTTLQDDDDLQITLAANSDYEIEYMIFVQSASTTPDFKFQFTEPDGVYRGVGVTSAVTSVQIFDESTAATAFSLDANAIEFMKGTIVIETAGAGGVFKLEWAQDTSDATATTVKKGSSLKAVKLA